MRERAGSRQILVFRHPSAGIQFVKGGLENGEVPAEGALRELAEESGITSVSTVKDKGTWNAVLSKHLWHFFLCSVDGELEEEWDFYTLDDGGLIYHFFWFDLEDKPDDNWHPVYQHAFEHIKRII